MRRAREEMKRSSGDSGAPFTDFRVEECDGLPKAVFDRVPPEQDSLLSYFLYPDKAYVGALYLDVMKVSEGEIPWMSYEDDFFRSTFRPDAALIETKGPAEQTGAPVRLTLPLGDVKFLLLRWSLECMRWEALRGTTGEDVDTLEAECPRADGSEQNQSGP
jgi:hypothetical protein